MTGKHKKNGKLWTFPALAQRWGVNVRTVQRRVETGEIPIVTLSPRVRRVSDAALREYERRGRTMPDDDAPSAD